MSDAISYELPETQRKEVERLRQFTVGDKKDEPSVRMVQEAIRDLDIRNQDHYFTVAIRTANLFPGIWNGKFQDMKASLWSRALLADFFDMAVSASTAVGGQLYVR